MRSILIALLLVTAFPARAGIRSTDPSRGHYLLAPSAFLLHGGELVLAQTEGFLSSAALGIAEHVDVTFGSAAPALSLVGTNVFNVTVAVKAGYSPAEILHLAAGFQTLSFPGAKVDPLRIPLPWIDLSFRVFG